MTLFLYVPTPTVCTQDEALAKKRLSAKIAEDICTPIKGRHLGEQ